MRRILAAVVLALAVAPAASAASPQAAFGLRAAGNPKIGYFVFGAAPGAVKRGAVIVTNSGSTTGTAELSTADATTGQTTGTVYQDTKRPTRAGAWISLAVRSLTLAPGRSARVDFTVHVPDGTAAGQYVGGIVAEASHVQASGAGNGKPGLRIRIRNLSIMAVQVNVPGPAVHRFSIGQVTVGGSKGFQQVLVRVSNRGNVLERPKGAVTVYDASGKAVETVDFHMETFLPQTQIDYPVSLHKGLPPGSYRAAVTLRYAPGAARTVTAKPSFRVTQQEVRRVFSAPSPTKAPPAVATVPVTTTSAQPVAAAPSTSGGSSFPWVWVAVGAGAVLVLCLLGLLLTRRRGDESLVVTIPTPAPGAPSPVVAATASPERQPEAEPEPEPEPEAASAVEPEPAAAEPGPAPDTCSPYHYWEVDYDAPELGDDGVWRFPHRCRNCGLELLARDVTDASERAAALR